MSGFTPYGRLERQIAASDRGSIWQRWEYGRRLLVDPAATTEAGNLRNGMIARLVDAAHRNGVTLSEREIQHRLQAGRTWPCKSQITHACAEYGSWGAVRAAGFPAIEAAPGDGPHDPRTAIEVARATERQLAFGDPEDPAQLPLFEYFPDSRFDHLVTLGELRKYAAEMAAMTEGYARRDKERADYLKRLVAAVHGDLSATWEEADAALAQKGEEEGP